MAVHNGLDRGRRPPSCSGQEGGGRSWMMSPVYPSQTAPTCLQRLFRVQAVPRPRTGMRLPRASLLPTLAALGLWHGSGS